MDDEDRSEYERAATGYFVWPLSLFALAREPASASTWSRIHNRQAATYGLVVSLGFLVLMALPLLIVIAAPAISTGATVMVYAAGLVADLLAFVALVIVTIGYASKAARGELFDIPLVSALADRIFRLQR